MKLSHPLPEEAQGLRLVVRGNAQRYFVHLRTGGTFLPWQYYQVGFDVTKGWAEVLLPFKDLELLELSLNRRQVRRICNRLEL